MGVIGFFISGEMGWEGQAGDKDACCAVASMCAVAVAPMCTVASMCADSTICMMVLRWQHGGP